MLRFTAIAILFVIQNTQAAGLFLYVAILEVFDKELAKPKNHVISSFHWSSVKPNIRIVSSTVSWFFELTV